MCFHTTHPILTSKAHLVTLLGQGLTLRVLLPRWKENATVFKKVGEHHQMGAQSMHFSPLDTGEKTFYYAHAPYALMYGKGNCR
jgi:hypothetical protein